MFIVCETPWYSTFVTPFICKYISTISTCLSTISMNVIRSLELWHYQNKTLLRFHSLTNKEFYSQKHVWTRNYLMQSSCIFALNLKGLSGMLSFIWYMFLFSIAPQNFQYSVSSLRLKVDNVMNAWCFRPWFCIVRLYWARDNLG